MLYLKPAVTLNTWSQRTFSAAGRKFESSAEYAAQLQPLTSKGAEAFPSDFSNPEG